MDILVQEPTSRWTAELERHFLNRSDVAIRWRPHFHTFREECRDESVRLLMAHWTEDADSLERVKDIRRRSRQPLFVLTEGADPHWEWLARELGADVLLPDTAEPDQVARLVERLLDR